MGWTGDIIFNGDIGAIVGMFNDSKGVSDSEAVRKQS